MTPWGGAQDEGVLGAGVDLQLEIGVEGLAVLDALDAAEEGLGEAADEEAEEDVDGDAEEGESQPSVLWRVSCQTVPRPKVGVRVHQWSKESIPQEPSGAGSRVRPCSLETDCCTGTEMSLPDLHDFEIFYMFSKTWKYRAGAH